MSSIAEQNLLLWPILICVGNLGAIGLWIDSRFFNNSLSFSFDWFKKDTKDMLMERPIPLYVGSGSPLSNVGTLTNQGIELEVGYKLSVDKVNLSSWRMLLM